MKRMQLLAFSLFALAFGLVTTGCDGQGRVTIKLTDATGDFKKAVVTISEVYLQGEDGKLVLSDKATTTNLLSLANDTADLVKDAVVPAGSYQELRFVISGAYIEVEQADGSSLLYATSTDYAGLPQGAQVADILQMPSFDASGVKVKLDGPVEVTGEQKIILVDFDVSQSFGKERGQGDKWVMKPVIKGGDIQFSGSVRVTLAKGQGVNLPTLNGRAVTLGDFRATLKSTQLDPDGAAAPAAEGLPLTDANGDGVYEAHFKFLIPGNFEIGFVAPGVGFTTDPAVPAPVTITSGQDQTKAFTLKSAWAW